MTDSEHIEKYYELTDLAMKSVFQKFIYNPKLILTESDLKCWLFIELQNQLKGRDLPFSVHTEITHYLKNSLPRKKYFMRDLTILNHNNLNLNDELWNQNDNKDYTLSKGFRHDGPALHFELKFVRIGMTSGVEPKLDSSDISNLNKVCVSKRAYCIVWGSKCDNVTISHLKQNLNDVIDELTNTELVKNNRLIIYLFDKNNFEKVELILQEDKVQIKRTTPT